MPTLSVITAAHEPGAAYLPETVASVVRQTLPPGWRVEWLIQEDGTAPCLAGQVAHIGSVQYEANGAALGIAATRNLALTRATGDLVQVLDSDDVLLPGALSAMIPLFRDRTVHWAVGQADDLMPNGSRVAWPSALPFGRVPAGAVNEWVAAHGANWPIHCAGLMLRTVPLRAVGGWVGLPGDEDVAMFAALSQIADGVNADRVTWLYRQHADQVTRAGAARHLNEQTRRFALQRARATRQAGMRFGPDAQFEHGPEVHAVEVSAATKSRPAL